MSDLVPTVDEFAPKNKNVSKNDEFVPKVDGLVPGTLKRLNARMVL